MMSVMKGQTVISVKLYIKFIWAKKNKNCFLEKISIYN